MAVDKAMRHRLHTSFVELWDAERAAAIMDLVAPQSWDELLCRIATKDDLQGLEYKLTSRIDRSEKRLMATLATGLFASQLTLVGGMYAIIQKIAEAL